MIPAECCGVCEMVVLPQDMSAGPGTRLMGSWLWRGPWLRGCPCVGVPAGSRDGAGRAFGACAAGQKGCSACFCRSLPQIDVFMSRYSSLRGAEGGTTL